MLQERPISKTILPRSRRTPQLLPLSIVPAATRRFHYMRRTAIVLGILEAA
jgi:hypothetical protein